MVNQARLGHPAACGAKLRGEAGLVSWEHVKMSNISFENQSLWGISKWQPGGSDDDDDDDDDDDGDDDDDDGGDDGDGDGGGGGAGAGGGEGCCFGWFCHQYICRNLL